MGNGLDIGPNGYGPRFRPGLDYPLGDEDDIPSQVVARREASARVVAMTVVGAVVAWFALLAWSAREPLLLLVPVVPAILVLVALHFTTWPGRRRVLVADVAAVIAVLVGWVLLR